MQDIPSIFYYNAICVISDLSTNKAGTITSGLDRFMEWKTKDGNYEDTAYASFETFYEGMFRKERLLDILKNFILFSGVSNSRFKVLAGYHQYFAVRKAIEKAKVATKTDGKGGVFWHTQGSGKSLSMVFYAHLLQDALDSPTIVVMTDRIDLDDQLYAQFSQCADFLRQTPVQAESKEHLKSLLDGRSANGIIFTTMFKFERGEKALSERRNIVVMADEAHRGQYGFDEKIVMSENENGEKEAHTVIGNARVIHDALPNATFIGFTGTPISAKDRNTREVFGDYIDVYDMTQAVEDGATRPVYYESRVVHLKLDENTLALIDSTYDVLEQQSDAQTIEKSKKMLGQMESVLGADSTIESLCDDIVEHYEKYRANLLTGKAMIVAYSRPIAMKIYRRILKIRPTWTDKVGVVMTGGNNDPEDWKEIIGTKAHKEELARKFKDNNDPMKIAIVVDMWLTGFDVPSLATMYVYKPMHGYNLMQAMSDRPFLDKMDMPGGFKESALRLNKYVVLQNEWNEKHIQERANELVKKAEAIWPYPTLTAAELAPYQAEEKTVQKYSLESYDVNAFTRMLFESLDKRIMNLSPAVKKEYKKLYVAYKLDTNFVDIVFQKQRLRISINMKFSEINDPNDICKDITGLGRWGNGDVELFMEHQDELDQIMEIVKQSYDTQAE